MFNLFSRLLFYGLLTPIYHHKNSPQNESIVFLIIVVVLRQDLANYKSAIY
jgi:hypothetical protein